MIDVAVVGAGHNGLAAAVTLARAGLSVRVYERSATPGGGTRTGEATLPGYRHDSCSAVHPLAIASPFFRAFRLAERVDFRVPDVSFAHALPGRDAGIAYRDLDLTAAALGADGAAYRRVIGPLAARAREVAAFTGSPLLRVPRHPSTIARFGLRALWQGSPLWNAGFRDDLAPAMITGVAAHAIARQPSLVGAAAGLALQAHAHAGGWPIPVGGSQAIADALVADLEAHGGEVITGHAVTSLAELDARATILDVTPRALIGLVGERMPDSYRRRLESFRYGAGAAKVDFALSGPVPWSDPRVAAAGTVHLGGTRAQIAAGEREVLSGRHATRPYVLVSQPTVVDASRAPAGHHTLWTYTHVPRGSTVDQTEAIVRTIEQVAPGFRDLIVASSSRSATQLADDNPNYVDGDIAAGAATMWQLLSRPVPSSDPWRTPMDGVYLTGASTAPGPGVHGQSGWFAARSALRHTFGITTPPPLSPAS